MTCITNEEIEKEILNQQKLALSRKIQRHLEDIIKNPQKHIINKDVYEFIEVHDLCLECSKLVATSYEPDYVNCVFRKKNN